MVAPTGLAGWAVAGRACIVVVLWAVLGFACGVAMELLAGR